MNQYFKCRLINLLEEIILSKNINKGKNLKKVRDLYQEIKNFDNKTKFMKNLLIDFIHNHENHGQIEKAIRTEYFER